MIITDNHEEFHMSVIPNYFTRSCILTKLLYFDYILSTEVVVALHVTFVICTDLIAAPTGCRIEEHCILEYCTVPIISHFYILPTYNIILSLITLNEKLD